MRGDQLPNESDIFARDLTAPVPPRSRHAVSVTESNLERKWLVQFFLEIFYAPTGRQTGATCASGLPAANSNCA